MGLPAAEVPQGQHPATGTLLKEHGGAAVAFDHAGQQTSIAAQGRVLAAEVAGPTSWWRWAGAACPGDGATADQQGTGHNHRCQAGGARLWDQLSKRELLSRGRLLEGVGRSGV